MAVSSSGNIIIDGSNPSMLQVDDKPTSPGQPRIRRRNRMITSCLECRRRKLKCDKSHPCANCTKFSRDCVFLAPALDSVSQMKLNEIKDKMGSLERVLEHDVAGKKMSAHRRTSSELPGQNSSDSENDGPVPDDEKGLEPTPLAVVDAAYEDDANDDMLDLGVKIGKMRMTERLGGYFRPKMTEELAFTLSDPTNDRRTAEEKMASLPMSPKSAEEFLEPGPTYIAPGSGFIFGDVGMRTSLVDFLPSKLAADTLVEQYRKNVHYIARVLHWPSFQVQYDNFWTNVLLGIEPTASLQAIVFSVMFSAIASMNDVEIATSFSRPKKQVLTNFQTGTEVALGKAHFLRTTKIETVQALVIYLIPMCRAELSRAHSVLVGTAIRLGECMGLHRDPGDIFGLPPVECHVRRLIWAQLCLLDIRTCEAQGPRPNIRREDFDTRFPLNLNDTELLGPDPKEKDTEWTDMTFSRMRFECNEMHRVVWIDRVRLEKKQVSLTHVLGKIESFRKAMEAKYLPIIDTKIPIQHLARLVMSVQLLRMHIMVLHRYHNSVTIRIPDRLRQIILTSGTAQQEAAIKIETIPELSPWLWYSGAWQQWQTAFLLLVEIYTYPMRKEADRIWSCLDFVFEPDLSLSRSMKGRVLLSEFRDKTAIYRDIRKVRAPVSMLKRLQQRPHVKRARDNSPPMTTENMNSFTSTTTKSKKDYGNFTGTSPPPIPVPNSTDTSGWTFDSPNTFLFNKNYTANSSGEFSQLPGIGIRQTSNWAATSTSPQPPHLAGGTSASPSDISTTDSWPPFITQGQQSWQVPLPQEATTGASQRGNMSAPPIPPQKHGTNPQMEPRIALAYPDGEAGIGALQMGVNNNNNNNGAGGDMGMPGDDAMMLDIDWGEWDKIFPPEINTGVLDMSSS